MMQIRFNSTVYTFGPLAIDIGVRSFRIWYSWQVQVHMIRKHQRRIHLTCL